MVVAVGAFAGDAADGMRAGLTATLGLIIGVCPHVTFLGDIAQSVVVEGDGAIVVACYCCGGAFEAA